jgi:protein involved in polysaccharide export with SLBB domain
MFIYPRLLTILALCASCVLMHAQAQTRANTGTSATDYLAKPAPSTLTLSSTMTAPGPRSLSQPVNPAEISTSSPPSEATERRNEPRSAVRSVPPSLFQRFVQEATGKLLPVYGSELFEAPFAYASDSAQSPPIDYVLGPGDEVRLQVWGSVDYSGSHVIDRNGQIQAPKAGVVELSGVKLKDLESILRNQLGKYYTNFSINANLGRLRSIQIYVVGQALQPGTYKLASMSTLVNALFASGGPTVNGSMRNIQLKRGSRTITTMDLYDFIAKGDKSRDVLLQSGDVIVIPPVGPRVAVTGAYDHAAIYELKPEGSSVGDILNLGGGVPALSTPSKALIERISRSQNPPRIVQEITLKGEDLKQSLQDGDVLTLLNISPAFGNAVTLKGTVASALRYRWFEGMKILDLIPERDALLTPDYYKRKNLLVQNAEALPENAKTVGTKLRSLADQINWEYAVIERLDPAQLNSVLLPFNLGKAVLQRDPAHNIALLPGDVITVLSHSDLQLPQDRQARLVRLEGEVAAPGVYQTKPGETLPQLLQRVGGVTAQAYLFGTEFSRESVRTRQQENLDVLIRRLEAQAQAQASSVVANSNAERAAQVQAVQQQQQAQLKSQIDRLKAARSNGRLSLELDPKATSLSALPALPLEDGDRVLIPSIPGFVAAFGAVNNENLFIHRSGKTVADVLKSAGLAQDADADQIFVLRADGTVVARRDRERGFFGSGFESLEVMPGDTVVVPAQIDRESRYNFFTRVLKDWTQIFANFGLGIAAIKTF